MVEKKSYKTLLEKIQRYSWECNDEEEAPKVVEKHFNEYLNILTNNDPAILTEHEKKEFKELVIEYFRIYKRTKEEEDEIGELKNYVEYIDAMTTSELLEEDNGLPNYIRDPNDKMYYLGEQQSKYLAHMRDRGMMQMELESAEGDLRKFVYKMYKKIYPICYCLVVIIDVHCSSLMHYTNVREFFYIWYFVVINTIRLSPRIYLLVHFIHEFT